MSGMRIFEPTSKYLPGSVVPTSIKRWTWTRSRGLRVEFLDGFACKSDWKSIRELLRASKEGREVTIREVK